MAVTIPGYKLACTLGKGGMATVYLAEQEIFERQVALKVMSRALGEDDTFGQRFFREARIVSQLAHPNIVTVYDVGVHEGIYYLSMEYIEGDDLKTARKFLTLKQKLIPLSISHGHSTMPVVKGTCTAILNPKI
jgi:Serine/threonine protein kinase